MRIDDRDGFRVQHLDSDGTLIATSVDTSDLIGNAWYQHVDVIAVPVSRLGPAFLTLRSQRAGEILQKAVNYEVTFAVVGDISELVAVSDAVRDFVGESNRGQHAWFQPDEVALESKLALLRAARAGRDSRVA